MKGPILIIEDDNDISQMLKELLEQHGYRRRRRILAQKPCFC